MSIGKNKGTTLYYAKQKSHDRIQTNDLERRIERMTTLSFQKQRVALAPYCHGVGAGALLSPYTLRSGSLL